MDTRLFEKLYKHQFISEAELAKIKAQELEPLCVHWDLRALLYLGVVVFTTGLGIVVYENIDTIGHIAMITMIGVACVACFAYRLRNSKGYSNDKIESPDVWLDYLLLLGCLLLLTFTGYIQYQYNVFGDRWGMAIFFPMVILFLTAYYFDHIGVLSLAITNLAAWAGLTVTPLKVLNSNDFNDERIIYTGLALGVGLVVVAFVTASKKIKKHFAFTYKNFGIHILFISCLAAMFHYENIYFEWFIVLVAVTAFFFRDALKERSFYFLVVTVLYAYIGLSYVVLELLFLTDSDMGIVYLGLIYFIVSGIGLIRLLIYYNKILKKDDSL